MKNTIYTNSQARGNKLLLKKQDCSSMKSSTIVIVGAGSAGLAAAYTVCKHSNVSRVILVEASDRVGGHAWTVKTPGGEEVDMGFMVLKRCDLPQHASSLS